MDKNLKISERRERVKGKNLFEEIISLKNLRLSWKEFKKGKTKRYDVKQFELHLENNLLKLHGDLKDKIYTHSSYDSFYIQDPKLRHIHKACVRDRVLHHAIFRVLYPIFDKTFIFDSYSCRIDKGTHKAMNRFREFSYIVSKNNTKTCWVLKCDIKKFFASISHEKLMNILSKYVGDKNILSVLQEIIQSFHTKNHATSYLKAFKYDVVPGDNVGLPLGNLTSQLFANVYMNQFNQFVKHQLKIKHYIRYADDFVMLLDNKEYLESIISKIKEFLQTNLKLTLHPNKIYIKTLSSGVDFLGWVHFFDHRVLRTTAKRRMFRRLKKTQKLEIINSYLGLISHGNSYRIKEKLLRNFIDL